MTDEKINFLSSQEIYIIEENEANSQGHSYIEQIERLLGKQTIIVLVGQRRVGKSCILKSLYDMKSKEPDANVISMSPLLTKSDEDGIVHLHLRKFLVEGL